MKRMNKLFASILVICQIFLLFSCRGDEIVKNGIDVSDEKNAFSKETADKSKEAFYSLFEGAYIADVAAVVPPQRAKEFREISERIFEITTSYSISEKQYLNIIDGIIQNKEDFVSLISGEDRSTALMKNAYRTLSAGGSSEYAGFVLYNLLSFGMDYTYNQRMERYEKYGYAYLYSEACEIKEKAEVLKNEIGEKNFSIAVRTAVMAAELFFGGALEQGRLESFSDREILMMISRVDIDAISVSAKGYEFLLGLAVPDAIKEDSGTADRILYAASKNGDLKKISSAMESLLALLVSAKENLADSDISLMRSGDNGQVLRNVFSRFGEDEWEDFSVLSTLDLDYNGYEQIFAEAYGEDFESYSDAFDEEISLSELKASVGEPDFLKKMEGYLAGISPVLAYRIFK